MTTPSILDDALANVLAAAARNGRDDLAEEAQRIYDDLNADASDDRIGRAIARLHRLAVRAEACGPSLTQDQVKARALVRLGGAS